MRTIPALRRSNLSAGALVGETFAKEAEENEHDRGQKFKDHFEKLSIIMLDVLFIGFIVLSSVWILHMIIPTQSIGAGWLSYIHGWLTVDQLEKIGGLLAGGVIAGLVADHFKRRMGG